METSCRLKIWRTVWPIVFAIVNVAQFSAIGEVLLILDRLCCHPERQISSEKSRENPVLLVLATRYGTFLGLVVGYEDRVMR